MSNEKAEVTVLDRDPRVGDTLLHDGRRWDVTDHSTYKNDEGQKVVEWCCELSDTEAYLLKEYEASKVRWFFTKWHPQRSVMIENKTLPLWLKKNPGTIHWAETRRVEGAAPPSKILFNGESYESVDTVVGEYEEDPGDSESKTTWEYWNATHDRNVAIEIWANGDVDVYQGAYVNPARLSLLEEPLGISLGFEVDDPVELIPVFVVGLFFLFFSLAAFPFDQLMAFVFPAAVLIVAFGCLTRYFILGLIAGGLAILGFLVYRTHAPLTTPFGLAATVGLPAIHAWIAVKRYELNPPEIPRFFAAFTTSFPVLIQGLLIYFSVAPSPRTVGIWFLSWGVSVVVGLIGYGIAWRVARPRVNEEPDTSKLIS